MTSQKRLTLVACILGSGIVFLDGTVVNVALPAIQKDLGASLAAQQWVVEAFLLTLSSFLLVGGSLDDIFERRTVFNMGLIGFGFFSLVCAVAPNVELLIAARALQGVAGALLVPSTLAIITNTFEASERGPAIGTWTAWTGISTVIGPLGGGLLIDSLSWRFIFLINVPLVLLTLAMSMRAIPRMEPPERGMRVDYLGALLCVLGLGGTVFALIEQQQLGFSDPLVAGSGIGGVVCLALFLLHEARTEHPMMPLYLFRSRNFAVGNFTTFAMYAGLGGALFFVGLYLQQVAGYSAIEAGAAFLPITVMMFFLSKRWGALSDRIGPRLFMGGGPILASVGMVLMMRIGRDADYLTEVVPGLLVFGLGLSMTVAPLTATVLSSVDQRHSGVASGVNNAISRIAGLIAIAALGAVVAAQFTSEVDSKLPAGSRGPAESAVVAEARTRALSIEPADRLRGEARVRVRNVLVDASTSGFRLGLGIGAGLVFLGGVVALVGIENPRRKVAAEECPGGQICGAPQDLGQALPVALPSAAPARA
jgi:EmrB/QacA subfamily drug resistance transporter